MSKTLSQIATALESDKTAIRQAILSGGGTCPVSHGFDSFADDIGTIKGSSSDPMLEDVVLYDYDGSIIKTYTKQEFLALSSYPAHPDRTSEGLSDDGWNWSLSDAKTQLNSVGYIDIGACYTPTESSHTFDIFLEVKSTSKSFSLTFFGNYSSYNAFTLYWGDGTSSTYNYGSSSSSYSSISHTYSSIGIYNIYATKSGLSLGNVLWASSASYRLIPFFNIENGESFDIKRIFLNNSSGSKITDFYAKNYKPVPLCIVTNSSTSASRVYCVSEVTSHFNIKNIGTISSSLYNGDVVLGNSNSSNLNFIRSYSSRYDLIYTSYYGGTADINGINGRLKRYKGKGVNSNIVKSFYLVYGGKIQQYSNLVISDSLEKLIIKNTQNLCSYNIYKGALNLKEIYIDSDVTLHSGNSTPSQIVAFNLEKITFKSSTPPTNIKYFFSFISDVSNYKIYVPSGSLSSYMTATGFSSDKFVEY